MESLPLPRVEIDIEGGRSARDLPVPFSVSSRLTERSLTLPVTMPVTIIPTRRSVSQPPIVLFATRGSPLALIASFVVGLISLIILLVRLDAFSVSAVALCIPLPFVVLLEVEEGGRFRASCID